MNAFDCILCSNRIKISSEFTKFGLITSDRRLWDMSASIGRCGNCGLIQRPRTSEWITECKSIYRSYDTYRQGKAWEPLVLMTKTDVIGSRSKNILELFRINYLQKEVGNWLDFGCGDGYLLQTCRKLLPRMKLYGTDFDETKKDKIEALANVRFLPELEQVAEAHAQHFCSVQQLACHVKIKNLEKHTNVNKR